MIMSHIHPPLLWLEPEQNFPLITQAWGNNTDAPGLLCAGGDLAVDSLLHAYERGIFPWYSDGQPILWWSPSPRMVLEVAEFQLHASLKKTLKKFSTSDNCEIRIDFAFEEVIRACASSTRHGQTSTWIVQDMIKAYLDFHRAGFAHSVETWVNGTLVGGLYFVGLGHAVFGESMFHRISDGSKIGLAALVCMCRQHNIPRIDCQQKTTHLSSLGARPIPREVFIAQLSALASKPAAIWHFSHLSWNELLPDQVIQT
jgi:leucyl/phenylalanyl-tRNA--protein transferase